MTNKKIVYTVLLVSLAVNLFLAGALFTHILRPGPDRPMPPPERFDMAAARDALDPEYRRVIDQVMLDLRSQGVDSFREMFELREQLRDILMAEDFDQQAFNDVYGKILDTEGQMRDSLQGVIAEIAAELPPDQRRKFFRAGFSNEHKGPPGPRRP